MGQTETSYSGGEKGRARNSEKVKTKTEIVNCEFTIVERWKRFCHNEIYNFIFSSLCNAAGEISATTNAKRERVNKWYIYCWFVWNKFEKRTFIARPLEMMVLFALLDDALCKRIDINSRRCGISAEKSIKNLLSRREMNVRVASNSNPIFLGRFQHMNTSTGVAENVWDLENDTWHFVRKYSRRIWVG